MTENPPALLQMRKITRSLQFGAMELRTDSMRSLFGNIKRVVRDLSRQLEKNIRIEVEGEDLEIDRNLIEKLEEPLLHMVRNSLDHGLGTPEERQAAGKDPQGLVLLKAERRGNTIVISVRDDGRGLDRKLILAKAIERNVIRKDSAESMTDSQVYNLIFTSGFSTQDTVSQISGRGVGMEIVHTMVTENRGRIEIETQLGRFTEFRLYFPLSTAIIDGMITRVGENLFVFPIGSVIESIKIQSSLISTVHGSVEVANLRGETIPVVRMHEVFGIPDNDPDGIRIGVVTENSEGRKFMLILNEVIAKREVVIKSLGNRFRNMRGISSGTVLSGGKIGLVLDVDQLVDLSLLGIAK
jgi:Chemotaxis protein histidine kinase and related kinases